MIFETNDVDSGWDGKLNGQLCPSGIYTYLASYEIFDLPGEIIKVNGTFTLIR
jgi:hypothetical protein